MSRLFKVTLTGGFVGEITLNIFHYRDQAEVFDEVDVANVWNTVCQPRIQAVIADTYRFISLTVERLDNFSPPQVYPYAPGVVGNVATHPMTPFDAVSGFFPVATRFTRSGKKRFPGITEGTQNGGVLEGIWMSAWEDVFNLLADTLVDAAIGELVPVVARGLGVPVVTSYLTNPIVAAILRGIGSQITRKFGRGAPDPTSLSLVPGGGGAFAAYDVLATLASLEAGLGSINHINTTDTMVETIVVTGMP